MTVGALSGWGSNDGGEAPVGGEFGEFLLAEDRAGQPRPRLDEGVVHRQLGDQHQGTVEVVDRVPEILLSLNRCLGADADPDGRTGHLDRAARPLGPTGVPLGIRLKAQYRTETRTLRAGDRLFLYTDGITEAANADGAQFGETRLASALECLREKTARQLVDGVIAAVDEFASGTQQFDDIIAEALIFGR